MMWMVVLSLVRTIISKTTPNMLLKIWCREFVALLLDLKKAERGKMLDRICNLHSTICLVFTPDCAQVLPRLLTRAEDIFKTLSF